MEDKFNLDPQTAKALYEFIAEHLDVVNDNPLVEQVMFDLEEQYNLP